MVIISGTTRHSIGLGNGLERIRAQSGLRPLREPMMTKTCDVTGFTSLDYVIGCVEMLWDIYSGDKRQY